MTQKINLPEILEYVQRCRYCRREMAVPPLQYAENPYCVHCLPERIKAKAVPDARKRWVRNGAYMKLM